MSSFGIGRPRRTIGPDLVYNLKALVVAIPKILPLSKAKETQIHDINSGVHSLGIVSLRLSIQRSENSSTASRKS